MLIALIEELATLTAEMLEELMLAFIGVKPPRRSRRKARAPRTARTAPRVEREVIIRPSAPRVYVVKKQMA